MPTTKRPKHTVVLDNGSGFMKAGFAGEKEPRAVFPSIVGRPRRQGVTVGAGQKGVYVGDEARAKQDVLSVNYPLAHGIVTSWDDMQAIWKHTFSNHLRVDPKECAVIMTEAPTNPKDHREKTAQLLFETFNVPRFYLATDAAMTAHALGRTTGVVLDMGDGVSHVVPIVAGKVQRKAVLRSDVAGRHLSEYMQKIMMKRGYKLTTPVEERAARDIKEKFAYVALDWEKELKKAERSTELEKTYKLADRVAITIGAERFRCAEPLFKPKLIGLEQDGIHKLILKSILRCDDDIQRELYGNVIMSGGTSMFDGIAERMHHELKTLAPDSMTIKIIAPPDRRHSAWAGAAALSSLSTFEEMWITKDEYDESGPGIVHRKCT